MRQYYSNNKNYNAILESMAQIRENQLNEMYGGRRHLMAAHGGMHGDEEEMEEGMHGDEEEMEERLMYEGEHEDDEDAQMEALAEMMDEALMELDAEDDEDRVMIGEAEEDELKAAKSKARLRNALLIGAGLVATGGLGAAAAMGKLPGGAGQQTMKAIGDAAGNVVTKGAEYIAPKLTAAGQALSGAIDKTASAARGTADEVNAAYQKGMEDAKRMIDQQGTNPFQNIGTMKYDPKMRSYTKSGASGR